MSWKDFWDYCEERQREERIIADMKIKDENNFQNFLSAYFTAPTFIFHDGITMV